MITLQIPTEISCPICNSEAIYKYGRTKTGKQRFQCLICGRQFSHGAKKQEIQGKPICLVCGKPMHLYKIEGELIRFRCSDYPVCKAFRKFKIKEED
jgi:transposase-like protein